MADAAKAIEALKATATNPQTTPSLKEAAVEGLGYAGGDKARATLIHILTHPQTTPSLKVAAARALGHAARS